jgi:hypothetical protein
MSIQKRSYYHAEGPFVLHKIPTVAGTKAPKMSAYFDSDGKIKDAEFMPSWRQVKRGSANWKEAERQGRIHHKIQAD